MYMNPTEICPRDLTARQFPPSSISDKSIFSDSSLTTNCAWKGTSSYYNINVNGDVLKDVAWYYPAPKDAAMNIKDHVAFCESHSVFHLNTNILQCPKLNPEIR